MASRNMPKTKKWLTAQNAEMARLQLEHPTMCLLRNILRLMGQASRDTAWLSEKRKLEKLQEAMRLIIEITSVAPPGISSTMLR